MSATKAYLGSAVLHVERTESAVSAKGWNIHGGEGKGGVSTSADLRGHTTEQGVTPTLSEALSALHPHLPMPLGAPSSAASKTAVTLQKHGDIRNEIDLQRYADMIKAAQDKSGFLLDYKPDDEFLLRRELYRLTNKAAASTGISAPSLLDGAVEGAGSLLGPLKASLFAVGMVKGTTKVTTLAQMQERIARYTERYVAKYEKAIKKMVDNSELKPDEKIKLLEWHLEHQYNLSERFHNDGPQYKGAVAARVEEKLHHALGEAWKQKQ